MGSIEDAAPAEETAHRAGEDRPLASGESPGPSAHVRYRPRIVDSIRVSAAIFRRAPVYQACAGLTVGAALTLIALGQPWGLLFLVLGLSFVSGLFIVPFAWLLLRRRPDLARAEVELTADPTGVKITTPLSTGTLAWSVFRRARETGDAFLLEPGTGQAIFILKRGADPTQLDILRTLLARAGLVEREPRRRRLMLVAAFVLGAAVLPGWAYITLSQRPAPNAAISLAPALEGQTVTVRGVTDLPDGTELAVQLIQRDEYDRARAEGAAPDPATSPWILVEYVTVEGGAFVVPFDVSAWPPGRGEVWAYFWMHPGQPAAAAQRYGTEGELLRGPDVVAGDDGRTLRVRAAFRVQ